MAPATVLGSWDPETGWQIESSERSVLQAVIAFKHLSNRSLLNL